MNVTGIKSVKKLIFTFRKQGLPPELDMVTAGVTNVTVFLHMLFTDQKYFCWHLNLKTWGPASPKGFFLKVELYPQKSDNQNNSKSAKNRVKC